VLVPGAAVEPAVESLDHEPLAAEELAPLADREPGEAELGPGSPAADAQRQPLFALVPVGPLVDPRLALEPASGGLCDVLGAGAEDIEDETAAALEQPVDGAQGGPPLEVALQV
jgi:hypothetical protein